MKRFSAPARPVEPVCPSAPLKQYPYARDQKDFKFSDEELYAMSPEAIASLAHVDPTAQDRWSKMQASQAVFETETVDMNERPSSPVKKRIAQQVWYCAFCQCFHCGDNHDNLITGF